MRLFIAIILLLLQSDSFSKFTYCVERSRGPYELQCVELNPAGKGGVRFKRRGGDEIKTDLALSASARERFLASIAATNDLDQGASYESNKKVADLGRKHLRLEMLSAPPREAEFNYSSRKEVIELVSFFDVIINQETIAFDIDFALQFDRLSIPKRLDLIENELKSSRISDPERLVPVLEKIQADQRLMNYARARAGKMKEQILGKKANDP
jgi:hypothetical protein